MGMGLSMTNARTSRSDLSLIIMHTLLTLALPFLIFVLTGCIDTRTAPVEYGAKASPVDIIEALNKPIENMYATDIKVGEFVAMETTQDLAYGAVFNLIGDSGATITDRREDANRVVYTGVLNELQYNQDGSYAQTIKEGDVLCASKVQCACGECKAPEEASKSAPALANKPLMPSIARDTLVSKPTGKDSAKSLGYTEPNKVLSLAAASAAPSYHHFSTWVTKEVPPKRVRNQPNCLGIPGCMINVYHVNFDQVEWASDPRGNKVHVEATLSPDVPYLSRNLSTCQTLLVNIGDSGSNILLKQCSNVFDFRYGAN